MADSAGLGCALSFGGLGVSASSFTLDVAGVHHDPDLVTHGFRRKIGGELSTNNTSVTMRPANLAPNAAVVGPILLSLSLVNVCNLLPQIPRHFFLCVHSFDLHQ